MTRLCGSGRRQAAAAEWWMVVVRWAMGGARKIQRFKDPSVWLLRFRRTDNTLKSKSKKRWTGNPSKSLLNSSVYLTSYKLRVISTDRHSLESASKQRWTGNSMKSVLFSSVWLFFNIINLSRQICHVSNIMRSRNAICDLRSSQWQPPTPLWYGIWPPSRRSRESDDPSNYERYLRCGSHTSFYCILASWTYRGSILHSRHHFCLHNHKHCLQLPSHWRRWHRPRTNMREIIVIENIVWKSDANDIEYYHHLREMMRLGTMKYRLPYPIRPLVNNVQLLSSRIIILQSKHAISPMPSTFIPYWDFR